MNKVFTSIFACFVVFPAFAQDHLSRYVDSGLANNQVLKEKNISLDQSILALKNSKSYILPALAFTANYLSARGGRSIALPMGDLLNNVYSTLNQLTSSQRFAPTKNLEEQFLPDNFYDAHFHITYPLFNADLYYNKEISRQGVVMKEYEADIYREELIKQIKSAYFNYCSALDAVSIYRNDSLLVSQNLKINRSLLTNGKGLPANVIRAESELLKVCANIIEAENIRINARNYLNFLVNRPLTDSVIFEEHRIPDSLLSVLDAAADWHNRSELKLINTRIELSGMVIKLNQSVYIPKLNTYLDLGSQASDFEYNAHSRYYFFGAQLEIPIFSGGRNKNNVKLAKLDQSSLHLQKDLLTTQLQLAASVARNNLLSALAVSYAAEKNLAAAKAYFNLIDKGFREGSNTLIEFIDARGQLTDASLKLNIARYNVLIQLAEYERQTATSKVK